MKEDSPTFCSVPECEVGGAGGGGAQTRYPSSRRTLEALISCGKATGDGKRLGPPGAELFSDMHLLAELLKASRAEHEAAASGSETHTQGGMLDGRSEGRRLGKTRASKRPVFSSSEHFFMTILPAEELLACIPFKIHQRSLGAHPNRCPSASGEPGGAGADARTSHD